MPKLYCILASDAPVGVILRRGPTAWYHVIRWRTDTDTFEHGAWVRGRIYEEKCDVSPDGQLFVYSIHQGSRVGTSYTDSWTAVSRVPWLHALALWPQGTTYGGGGYFVGNRELCLTGVGGETHPDHPLRGIRLVSGTARPEDDDRRGTKITDHRGRNVRMQDGCVIVSEEDSEILVADFRDLNPDPQPPPGWATKQLS